MAKVSFEETENDEKYLFTIRSIRARNFGKNLPFLILSDKLPEGLVYREFPDGHIELQQVFIGGAKFQHKVVRILGNSEADMLRKEHGLL